MEAAKRRRGGEKKRGIQHFLLRLNLFFFSLRPPPPLHSLLGRRRLEEIGTFLVAGLDYLGAQGGQSGFSPPLPLSVLLLFLGTFSIFLTRDYPAFGAGGGSGA